MAVAFVMGPSFEWVAGLPMVFMEAKFTRIGSAGVRPIQLGFSAARLLWVFHLSAVWLSPHCAASLGGPGYEPYCIGLAPWPVADTGALVDRAWGRGPCNWLLGFPCDDDAAAEISTKCFELCVSMLRAGRS